MKKKLISICLCLMLLVSACSSYDDTVLMSYETEAVNTAVQFPDFSSSYTDLLANNLCVVPQNYVEKNKLNIVNDASLLFNVTDEKILYANNVYQRVYPASLTKLATALVVFKYGNFNDDVIVGYNATHINETGIKLCGFSEGDKINLKELLYCLLIYSGNDAAIAIAEHISGSEAEFTKLMNEEMRKLGATNSNFINSHGLHDENHYTTAYDLYLVFNELIKNETFIDIIKNSSYNLTYTKANGTKISRNYESTNKYLLGTYNPPENITVIGGKTGTTSMAGSCLILYSKDANQKDYISIILKSDTSDNLFSGMTNLLSLI